MTDFFEIDFLDVESKKSGDAVPMRYSINGIQRIHIRDGGSSHRRQTRRSYKQILW